MAKIQGMMRPSLIVTESMYFCQDAHVPCVALFGKLCLSSYRRTVFKRTVFKRVHFFKLFPTHGVSIYSEQINMEANGKGPVLVKTQKKPMLVAYLKGVSYT